jgi:hypothetical protein
MFRKFMRMTPFFVPKNWTKHIVPKKSQQDIGFIFAVKQLRKIKCTSEASHGATLPLEG